MSDNTELKLINDLITKVGELDRKVNDLTKPLNIKINYHKNLFPELQPLEKNGNFYDLRSAQNINLIKDKHTLIPLGISVQLPEGYYAKVVARSSSFKNFGFILANAVGIIDTGYAGPDDLWFLSVIPSRDCEIHVNDRIAQFTISREVKFTLEEGEWEAENRGGHGSSGIK